MSLESWSAGELSQDTNSQVSEGTICPMMFHYTHILSNYFPIHYIHLDSPIVSPSYPIIYPIMSNCIFKHSWFNIHLSSTFSLVKPYKVVPPSYVCWFINHSKYVNIPTDHSNRRDIGVIELANLANKLGHHLVGYTRYMGVSIVMRLPQHRWFVLENPYLNG